MVHAHRICLIVFRIERDRAPRWRGALAGLAALTDALRSAGAQVAPRAASKERIAGSPGWTRRERDCPPRQAGYGRAPAPQSRAVSPRVRPRWRFRATPRSARWPTPNRTSSPGRLRASRSHRPSRAADPRSAGQTARGCRRRAPLRRRLTEPSRLWRQGARPTRSAVSAWGSRRFEYQYLIFPIQTVDSKRDPEVSASGRTLRHWPDAFRSDPPVSSLRQRRKA